jgi:cytidylate kinase
MIIGLSGKMRSGKDTIANWLVESYGFKKVGFADKLYDVCRDLFGMEGKDRTLLQVTGNTMRTIDPLVWIKYVWRQVADSGDVVIPDMRYQNEFDYLFDRGAFMIRLNCAEDIRVRRAQATLGVTPTREQLDFISEVDLDNETRFRLTLDTGTTSIIDIEHRLASLLEQVRFKV